MRRKVVLLQLAAVGLLLAPGEGVAADKAPTGGTICQGNTIYVVCVDDVINIGRYTARTGPSHPVPDRNLLFGGESSAPGTSFSSYRSFTTGTDYVQGFGLNPVASTSSIGTTGVRTTYNITSPDSLEIVQDVNVNGTTLADSNVEVTTRVTNTGTSSVSLGVRYLWDFQIGADDGPTFRERAPDGAVRTVEAEFAPPAFAYYEIQDNDFDDPTSPLYTVLGSATGPTTTSPPAVAPTQITYGCWAPSFGTSFDYSVIPADCASGGGDTDVLYWWGRSSGNAMTLGSGQSTTVRALLFATEPGAPPPFGGEPGRMTGGGTIKASGVHHGSSLQCDATKQPNNLQVNWGGGKRFHLENLTSASCTDDPSISEGRPVAGFDTYRGTGTGRYRGQPGATAEWTMTDAGEPGRNDTFRIKVTDEGGNVVLDTSGKISGNHQAHPSSESKASWRYKGRASLPSPFSSPPSETRTASRATTAACRRHAFQSQSSGGASLKDDRVFPRCSPMGAPGTCHRVAS